MKRLAILLVVALTGCATAPHQIATTQPPAEEQAALIDPYSAFQSFMNVLAFVAGDIGKSHQAVDSPLPKGAK